MSDGDFKEKKGSLFQLYRAGKIEGNIVNTQEQKIKSFSMGLKTSDKAECQFTEDKEKTSCSNSGATSSNLIVNRRQKGNIVLEFIRNVRWEFGDIEPDFVMGRTSCALFLSLHYHNTKPNYIFNRVRDMKNLYDLRILLVLVDVTDSIQVIKDLTTLCLSNNFTMLLAWSDEEVARYLESFKAYEHKPPDILTGERVRLEGQEAPSPQDEEMAGIVGFLSSIPSVNKTDARTLIETFGTIEAIMTADFNQLKSCPGLGALKARKIFELFRKPVLKNAVQDDNE